MNKSHAALPTCLAASLTFCLASLFLSCASNPSLYTRSQLAGKEFTFKSFDIEINRKLNIVTFDCLDSQNHLDILPIAEIKAWAEAEWGIVLDTSEFETLRTEGKLASRVGKDEKNRDIISFGSDELRLCTANVGGLAAMGLVGILSGTSWAGVNWSEFDAPLTTMSFQNKTDRGLSQQMQIQFCLGPIGSFARVTLRMPQGEPDKHGTRELVVVAERKIPIAFEKGVPDSEIIRRYVTELPVLLAGTRF